jgi:histone H3/H4
MFFENSIIKIAHQVSNVHSISSNTKEQLNSMTRIFLKKITYVISKFETKKLNNLEIIKNILFIFLSGDLLSNSIKEGNKSLEYFKNSDTRIVTRQQKSRLLISPSLVEKEIGIKMSPEVSIFITSIIEYVIAEIINASIIIMKHKRISINDINEGIKNDIELSNFLVKIKVRFFTEHKLVLAKSSFRRIIKMSIPKKITQKAVTLIQHFIENYILKILVKANVITQHTGRIKLLPSDILILKSLITETYDIYSITQSNSINLLEI